MSLDGELRTVRNSHHYEGPVHTSNPGAEVRVDGVSEGYSPTAFSCADQSASLFICRARISSSADDGAATEWWSLVWTPRCFRAVVGNRLRCSCGFATSPSRRNAPNLRGAGHLLMWIAGLLGLPD